MSVGNHTVEKIGGTSMACFGDLMKNIIIGNRKPAEYYNRIFVVSAYAGITNFLLEDKKTGQPGIYGEFAEDGAWQECLEKTRAKMIEYNRSFESLGLDQIIADKFVNERMDGIKSCLEDLQQLRTFGHFQPQDYLPATREFLSAVGEAHSAFNSVKILNKKGINAVFVDLSGWRESIAGSIEDNIERNLSHLDFSSCLPIVTGYAKCIEGIMNKFDRGYSEITFSKIAVVTNAREGIIHKEYHLSTGDPKLIGVDKVKIIGNTNFDIADQLADMAMEAIHPRAAKEMELSNIHIRVKNAFDPEHPGTLISKDYISPEPRVEMICGRQDIVGIELFDPEMVGQSGYDYRVLASFAKAKISYIAKNTNANTITHFVAKKHKNLEKCIAELRSNFPGARISIYEVAIVSVIGSNMRIPGFLSRAAKALAENNINILALDQCLRQVNMQFMIEHKHFETAQIVLHREFVEK
ncbi:MAG: aspartate kinase [Victivallaceae bacterium]|nr:aspartate kinase [Victivallaceae bacterium]MDD4181023.1 aspartate kinase [Victivallaceae bacterium]